MAELNIKNSIYGVVGMLILGLVVIGILPTMSEKVSTYATNYANDSSVVIVVLFTFIMAIVVLLKFLDQI